MLQPFTPPLPAYESTADEAQRALWERAVACAWLLNSIVVELNPHKPPLTRLAGALQALRAQVTATPLDEEAITVLETELQTALAELESTRTLIDAGTREVIETLRTLWTRRADLRRHGVQRAVTSDK